MNSPGPLLVVVLASGLAIGPGLAAQGDAPQPGHWSCQTVIVNHTIYLSGVFDETALMNEVATGFAQLLVTKYGFKDHVSCGRATMSGSTLAGLQAGQKDQVAQLRKRGETVVETGWIFVPAKASLPYVCAGAVQVRKAGQTQDYYYMTGVMELPGNSVGDLGTAWHDYLKGLHPGFLFNPAGCNLLSADPALRQTQVAGMVDQFKAYKYEITPVDWTYRPGQAAAAPDQRPGYYCQLLSPDDKTWYVSKVLPVQGAWNLTTYNQAWTNFVSKDLKLDPTRFRGGCESGPMKNEQDAWAARKEQLNGTAGEQIFEVDWKYTPGQEVAPAAGTPPPVSSARPASTVPTAHAAPPASPAPKPQEASYFCLYIHPPDNGQGPATYYLTGVFSSATPFVTINQAWRDHIVEAYQAEGQARGQCTRVGPNPTGQQTLINAITNAAKASKAQVITVDWRP